MVSIPVLAGKVKGGASCDQNLARSVAFEERPPETTALGQGLHLDFSS